MRISLDDVSCLLHIPIIGQFPTSTNLKFGEAVALLIELLGVQSSNGKAEIRQCRSQHVRLSWLRDIYEQFCEAHYGSIYQGLFTASSWMHDIC